MYCLGLRKYWRKMLIKEMKFKNVSCSHYITNTHKNVEEIVFQFSRPLYNLAKKSLTFLMHKHSSDIHFHCFTFILLINISENTNNIHNRSTP